MIIYYDKIIEFEDNKEFINEGVPVHIDETGKTLMKFDDKWVDVDLINEEVHHAKD